MYFVTETIDQNMLFLSYKPLFGFSKWNSDPVMVREHSVCGFHISDNNRRRRKL